MDLNFTDSYMELSCVILALGEVEITFETDETDPVVLTLSRTDATALRDLLNDHLRKEPTDE